MKKILFIKPIDNMSFIENDEQTLKSHFKLATVSIKNKNMVTKVKSYFFLLYTLIFNFNSYDIIFIWFADYHSFFPSLVSKLTSKKCFIVIGGYDAAKFPELKYGAHLSPIRSYIVKKSCEWCTYILPVSKFTERNLFNHIKIDLGHKSKIIFNSINTNFFLEDRSIPKQNKVVYLANIDSEVRWKIKNIDFVIEISKLLPETTFEFIGLTKEFEKKLYSYGVSNIISVGYLSKEDFKSRLAEAKVICLFSIYESFGISIGEGILMGCIPISMSFLGAAELIGDENCLLKTYNAEEAANKIKIALRADQLMKDKFIASMKENFSIKKREKELIRIILN